MLIICHLPNSDLFSQCMPREGGWIYSTIVFDKYEIDVYESNMSNCFEKFHMFTKKVIHTWSIIVEVKYFSP